MPLICQTMDNLLVHQQTVWLICGMEVVFRGWHIYAYGFKITMHNYKRKAC